jgi:hypothetical protein
MWGSLTQGWGRATRSEGRRSGLISAFPDTIRRETPVEFRPPDPKMIADQRFVCCVLSCEDEALKQPFSITRNGRDRPTVLAVDYQRLKQRGRAVRKTEDLSLERGRVEGHCQYRDGPAQ